jgi:hypothetical protein
VTFAIRNCRHITLWRDNLDENGAAIRMRAGSRDDMMIMLSPGLCKPLSGAALQLPCVIATGRGKPQVQPFPQCPESDSWPSKWRPSRWAKRRHDAAPFGPLCRW